MSMARAINLPLLQMSWEVSNLMISLRRKPGQVRDAQPLPFSRLRSASFVLSLTSGESSVSVPATAN